jgi:Ca2+-binding EF-hand superfamily protein
VYYLFKYLNSDEINKHNSKADTAISTAEATLASGNYLGIEDLQAKLDALKTRKLAVEATLAAVDEDGNSTFDYSYDSTYSDVADVIAELKAIEQEAYALNGEAADAQYVFGDVNDDKVVDAFDFQTLLGYILNDKAKDSTDKSLTAADANNDGKINVADLVGVYRLMNGTAANQVRMQMRLARQEGNNVISIEAVGEVNGAIRYAINLNNASAFVAGQFDINLPAGMTIVSESMADRASSMNLASNDLSDGRHRIVFIGDNSEEIDGNSGAVVYIDVMGTGKPEVLNAQFSDSNAVSYDVATQGATGIDAIYESIQSVGQKIYDASGRLMNRIQRGINIIRKSDGTTTKEFHNSDK